MDIIEILALYAAGCVACAIAGSYREIGTAAGFALGVFLTPIFGMGVVLSTDSKAAIAHRQRLEDALIEYEEDEE